MEPKNPDLMDFTHTHTHTDTPSHTHPISHTPHPSTLALSLGSLESALLGGKSVLKAPDPLQPRASVSSAANEVQGATVSEVPVAGATCLTVTLL